MLSSKSQRESVGYRGKHAMAIIMHATQAQAAAVTDGLFDDYGVPVHVPIHIPTHIPPSYKMKRDILNVDFRFFATAS